MTARAIFAPLAATLVLIAGAWTQTTKPPANRTPEAPTPQQWAFSAGVYGSIVPDDTSYFTPIFTADRSWLHLEARYNYEDLRTGSLWAGYNWSVGKKINFQLTPMVGAVFGRIDGIAPGYATSLTYKRVAFYSSGEYMIDAGNHDNNFFYTWNEFVYTPVNWFHAGLVMQHTQAYHTPLDLQRGFSAGIVYKQFDFTTYVFNVGFSDPTAVLGLAYYF